VEEQEPISVQKLGPVAPMEDSPILGVLSKAGATESVTGMAEDASVEDGEGVAEWSPVTETIVETNDVEKDVVEATSAVKRDGFTVTNETVHSPEEILRAATGEDVTSEEDLAEEKEGSAGEMQQAKLTEEETSDELDEDEELSSDDDDDASEEIDSTDEREVGCTEVRTDFHNVKELVQMMQGTEIAVKANENPVEEASEDDDEESTEDDGSADEESTEDDGSADEEASEDDGSVDEEASEDDGSVDEEASEDGLAEEDDFITSDLPLEFDDIVVLSDAETVSVTTSTVKENQVAVASATRVSVKSMDDPPISVTNEEEVSEEKDVIEEAMKEVASTVGTIVKSLDECTIKEGTHQADEEKLNTRVEAVGQKDYSTMSMRKLRATLKNQLAMV
jgi:hypothetical protein